MNTAHASLGTGVDNASPRSREVERRCDGSPCDSKANETYDLGLLEKSIGKWRRSPALRTVYEDIYRSMTSLAPPGAWLEIGSGIGVMREFVPGLVTSDVHKTRFVDCAASAYAVEEVPGRPWSAIFMLDVLHHLREPLRFFTSASRALAPGGCIVICDPAATVFGRMVYRTLHHEPVAPERICAPYLMPADNESGEYANMGMAWALFVRDRLQMAALLQPLGLRIATVRFRDVFSYLGSGGFSKPALLPASLLRRMQKVEDLLPHVLLERLALRMLVVLEKIAKEGGISGAN